MVDVSFDRKSLMIDGERRLILSGAMHYYRLPSPDMWRSRLRRIKEIGLNTVDLYFYWGYHSPAPGEYDFTGHRDVDLLMDMVEEEGLMLMARPGPYICSEVDGGGFPAWLLANEDMKYRCRDQGKFVYDPEYMKAVREWYERIIPKIARRQNLILFQIENEYHFLPTPRGWLLAAQKKLQEWFGPNALFDLQSLGPVRALMIWAQRRAMGRPGYINSNRYLRELYQWSRELGVTVPIFHNDVEGAMERFVDVDVVGIDDYPIKSMDADWRGKDHVFASLDLMEDGHNAHGKDCPLLVGEIQGGWFDLWGGLGYPNTRRKLGASAQDLTLKTVLSQGATVISMFMTCGGTTWGYVGSPDVYSSFDYGAPITEGGQHSARSHALTEFVDFIKRNESELCQAVTGPVLADFSPALYARARRAPSGKRFLFFRNSTKEDQRVKIGDVQFYLPPDQMLALVVDENNKIIDRCEPAIDAADPVRPKMELPRLGPWKFGMVSQPLALDFDDSDWTAPPAGGPLSMDAIGAHYGYAWYRARLSSVPSEFTLDARHTWAAYLNGRLLRAYDNHKNRLATGDDMAVAVKVRVPAEYRREGENVLCVLVESLGHNKGFLEDSANPRGIVSFEPAGAVKQWRVRGGLLEGEEGITPRVDFGKVALADESEVDTPHQWPAEVHGVGLYQTSFELDLAGPDDPPVGLYIFTALEKANIYLNGWLIGRYWDSVGPQKVFYLPSGLLNHQGENHLAVTLWRWEDPARISKLQLTMYP